MKRALKNKSSIYKYLEPYFATGNEELIAKARKEYWKKYSVEWRKKKRQVTKHYTIDFTSSEAKRVIEAAKKHKRSATVYIKQSCFAYMNSRYLPIDAMAMNEIFQLLAMNYNALKKIIVDGNLHYQTGQNLLQQMAGLEQRVNTELRNPKSLEQWIIETIQANPKYKETLKLLLQKL
jgi:hypothetical protein